MKIFLIFFHLLFVLSVSAQVQSSPLDELQKLQLTGNNPCNLTLKESPVIRGLKLGMTKQEVEKVIPSDSGIKLDDFVNYLTTTQISKIKGFETMTSLDITFMPESIKSDIYRTKSLAFKYKNDVAEWDSVSEFAENLSNNLNLPFGAWVFSNHKGVMICKDFRVTVFENYIQIESTILEQQIKELKEQKKKVFKP